MEFGFAHMLPWDDARRWSTRWTHEPVLAASDNSVPGGRGVGIDVPGGSRACGPSDDPAEGRSVRTQRAKEVPVVSKILWNPARSVMRV